jgi:membrane protein implicated in regulation of membrane protease activity
MHVWFWGWLVAAAAMAAVSAVARDRAALPFALGAGLAAALDAAGAGPVWQWAAFVGVSFIVFAVVNRPRHRPQHLRRGLGRHGVARERES